MAKGYIWEVDSWETDPVMQDTYLESMLPIVDHRDSGEVFLMFCGSSVLYFLRKNIKGDSCLYLYEIKKNERSTYYETDVRYVVFGGNDREKAGGITRELSKKHLASPKALVWKEVLEDRLFEKIFTALSNWEERKN